MQNRTILVLALATTLTLIAKEINLSPKSVNLSCPKGSHFFSEQSEQPPATPLAELLRFGSGVVEFTSPVTFEVEEADKEKAAVDGSSYVTVRQARQSFPFIEGRYRLPEKVVEKSATRIFTSDDGWIVIQRGRYVSLIPLSAVKSVSGVVPDREVGDNSNIGQGQPAK